MRRHHTGSGRRSVFPPDWQSAHSGIVSGTFTAVVVIGDPESATEAFNPTSGTTDVTPGNPVYSGPAAVEMVTDPAVLAVVDAPDTTSLYKITLPVDVDTVTPALVVHVTASPDAQLVGRDLVVTGPQLGDRRLSRVLHAVLNN